MGKPVTVSEMNDLLPMLDKAEELLCRVHKLLKEHGKNFDLLPGDCNESDRQHFLNTTYHIRNILK